MTAGPCNAMKIGRVPRDGNGDMHGGQVSLYPPRFMHRGMSG